MPEELVVRKEIRLIPVQHSSLCPTLPAVLVSWKLSSHDTLTLGTVHTVRLHYLSSLAEQSHFTWGLFRRRHAACVELLLRALSSCRCNSTMVLTSRAVCVEDAEA